MAEAESNIHFWCSICELKGSENEASVWCPECEQALCTDCDVQHRISRSSENHTTTSVQDYKRLPSIISGIKSYCGEHKKPLELYCPEHNETCCVMCLVMTHRCCASITPLQHILNNTRTDDLLSEHERNINDICNFVTKTRNERNASLQKFREQIITCEKEIVAFRKNLNERLDEVQSEIMNQLYESLKQYESKTTQLNAEIEEIENNMKQLNGDIEKIKSHATIYQTFLASADIGSIVYETETLIQKLESNVLLQEIDLHSLPISEWENKAEDFKLMNAVHIISNPNELYLKSKEKQAQISMILPRPIDSYVLNIIKTIEFWGHNDCNIVGCSIRPGATGELVFSDFSENERLLVFNADYSFQRLIRTDGQPCCLIFVSDTKVAVTFASEHSVKILDFSTGQVLAEKILEEKCVGLAYSNGHLYIRSYSKIYKLDHSVSIIQTINLEGGNNTHIAVVGRTIITCTQNKIYWLDADGKQIRTYETPDIQSIDGLTVDNSGNVYVSGYRSDNIAVISQNGLRHKILLNTDDGISLPTGILYDKFRNTLVIVTDSKSAAAAVYDLST